MKIRMSKTKQEVSGDFRSQDGCDAFDVQRSYIATAIKHEISVFDALFSLTSGNPLFTGHFWGAPLELANKLTFGVPFKEIARC